MIRDVKAWQEWENAYIASTPPEVARNLQLVDGMYELARMLGVFPLQDPLEGIETKIEMARVVNVPVTCAAPAFSQKLMPDG